MSQNTFEVVFSGKLVEGAAPQKVKANVAALFKVEVAKVERLFSGATVSIKKGVDEVTAKKYQLALYKAGAITRVVNRAAAAAAPKAAVAKPAAAPQKPAAARKPAATAQSAANVGLQKSLVKPAPAGVGELAGAGIDAPGTVLVEHQDIPRPEIDTSGLQIDLPGAELIEHEEVAEPEFDLSGITMGPEGEALGEETPFEPLEVDVSGIDMDEPGVILKEHEEVPKPQIDTSNLSLE
jgi:hypothetical protein